MIGERNGNPKCYGHYDYKDSTGYVRRLLWKKMERRMNKIGYEETVKWVMSLTLADAMNSDYIKRVWDGEKMIYKEIDEKASIEYMRKNLLEILRNW